MFADAFLPNLVLFVLGQAAAIAWLRTGMTTRGVVAMVMIWLLADAALLAHLALGRQDFTYHAPLALMQLWAAFEAVAFSFLRVRAWLWRRRRQRREQFAAAHVLYLRGDHGGAIAAFARLRHFDPWDVAAAVAQANALAANGAGKRAERLLRKARALDLGSGYRDFIDERLQQLAAGRRGTAKASRPHG